MRTTADTRLSTAVAEAATMEVVNCRISQTRWKGCFEGIPPPHICPTELFGGRAWRCLWFRIRRSHGPQATAGAALYTGHGDVSCRLSPWTRRSSGGWGGFSGRLHHATSRLEVAAADPSEAPAADPPGAPAARALLLSRCEMCSICSTCERHTGHLLLCLRSSCRARSKHTALAASCADC